MYPSRYCLYTLLLLLFSCQPEKKRVISHSFYYWKSTYSIWGTEKEKLEQLKADHLYIHYFDVDWSETVQMPIPKAVLRDGSYQLHQFPQMAITPVVFITNRTFEMLPDSGVAALAQKISTKIRQLNNEMSGSNAPRNVSELQIDCDWTATTRQRYFAFLQAFKQENPGMELSATIRLYPYRYPEKMGIPPVDKGILMCYNLGKITAPETQNSVFDLQELRQYLDPKAKKYPLPLDLVFPIFGWYAWFRDNQFKNIVYNDKDLIADTTAFAAEQGHRYRFCRDTVINDNYFREGDVLRMEFPEQKELTAAIELVTSKISDYHRIAFYYWHLPSITTYESVIQETFDHR